jgi:cell division protein FtsB
MSESTTAREALAKYAHEAWSGWMEYLFSQCPQSNHAVTIPGESALRWKRQMSTPYDQLPESEKASDRVEADKMLAIIGTSKETETLARVRSERDALEAELTALKHQLPSMQKRHDYALEQAARWGVELDVLKDERDALRELVRDMADHLAWRCKPSCRYVSRARELGVLDEAGKGEGA